MKLLQTPLSRNTHHPFTTMIFIIVFLLATQSQAGDDGIRPWSQSPHYWQYKGQPIVLAGGSKDDNLFQIPDLKEHLDEMKAVGANYVRNTMSDRHDLGFEVYPFAAVESGKYDLEKWNEEYWRRFENFLNLTAQRDIIVQIEVWDRFDYSDSSDSTRWKDHPYNPKNNINYTEEQTGLKFTYLKHPGSNEQPFFFSVPALKNILPLLKYQRSFVEKMLSFSLQHGHVLYCMDNETSGAEEWGAYWADFIREHAREKGTEVFLTEMWDPWNLKDKMHRRTFDHPERYSFIDVSQNNHNSGQEHWDNLQWVLADLQDHPRPVNCVKTYGADGGRYGNNRDGEERFWRNLIGGTASCRFHRPASGLGLNASAKAHIRSFRLFLAEFPFFDSDIDSDCSHLADREPNEAYLRSVPGKSYAIYFPDGGNVLLNLEGIKGSFRLKWLDITQSQWASESSVEVDGKTELAPPGKGHWLALLLL